MLTGVTTIRIRSRPGNLPAELTGLVDRRREVADLKRLLETSRVVTLLGMGGIGKTRVALQAGHELVRAFPDGVWIVHLAALPGPDLLEETIESTLGARESMSNGGARGGLLRFLAERQALLILDSCERHIDACAALLTTLLPSCPDLKVLTTSQRRLGLSGEHVLPIHPLRTPASDASPDAVLSSDAAQLFVERARAVAPSFVVDEDNCNAVAELCRRLDGIPVALELAAARAHVLSPWQMLQRLADGYGLLRSGGHAASERQRSLHALMDWSFDLCTAAEQTLWQIAAVFPGDWDLDAIEAVYSDAPAEQSEVLDLLEGLVDRSIVVAEPAGGEVRYRMLDIIRSYGWTRLSRSGGLDDARRRHRDHFLSLASWAEDHWFGPTQLECLRRLSRDFVNLRSALEYTLEEQEPNAAAALSLARMLSSHCVRNGQLREASYWLQRALDVPSDPSPAHVGAWWECGLVETFRGDLDGAQVYLDLAARHGRQLDPSGAARAIVVRGTAAAMAGDLEGAAKHLEEALVELRNLKDEFGEPFAAVRLGQVYAAGNDRTRAKELYQLGLERLEAAGESWMRAGTLSQLALLVGDEGDPEQATTLARESLRLFVALEEQIGIVDCVELLAWLAGLVGDHRRAAWLLGAGEAMRRVAEARPYYLVSHQERCIAQTKAALPPATYAKLFRDGFQAPVEQVTAYALGEEPAVARPDTRDDGLEVLTRREREVAALLAEGLSNKEIAARLVIAPRTAETHVENVLMKLGLRSRSRVAAWFVRQQDAATGA